MSFTDFFQESRSRHFERYSLKVSLRWSEGGLKDLLDYGELPEKENCEISRWELGTLNYEALAGFCGTEEYLAGAGP